MSYNKLTQLKRVTIAAGVLVSAIALGGRHGQAAPKTPELEIKQKTGQTMDRTGSVIRIGPGSADPKIAVTVTVPQMTRPVPGLDPDKYIYNLKSLNLISNFADLEKNSLDTSSATVDQELDVSEAERQDRVITLRAAAQYAVFKVNNGAPDQEAGSQIQQDYALPPVRSPEHRVMFDAKAPEIIGVDVERFPGGSAFLYVELEEDDFDESSLEGEGAFNVFEVKTKVDGNTIQTSEFPVELSEPPEYSSATKTITLPFDNLNPGEHRLTVDKLKDRVGNQIANSPDDPNPESHKFTVPGGPQRGEHIEYPEFLPSKETEKPDLTFDPGDKVETRVARLYYYRDARRVVKIINRNVRNLNQTEYDEAQRLARQAREDAEDRIQERRQAEAEAIQAAREARRLRNDLEQAQENLQESLQKKADLKSERARTQQLIDDLTDQEKPSDSAEGASGNNNSTNNENNAASENSEKLGSLKALRARLNSRITATDIEIGNLRENINALQTSLRNAQDEEVEKRQEVQPAEARELRAEKEQFRRNVAAGLADPDTYVAGDKDSVDPVTQVSMSVIGEGLIQMRGPIKGINKIRRMIHQIDSPVGQVKVGIHTVQINGEHGDRMEKVYEKIHRHIDHARFLANTSGKIFRKAVAHVASSAAAAVENGYEVPAAARLTPEMIPEGCSMHKMKYLYAFFGTDFIEELRKMDSSLLKTDNKLLSLNSMDTISLSGALFVTALANNTCRQMIVEEFQRLIYENLVPSEVEYVRALTRTRHANQTLNKIATRHFQGMLDKKDAERIREKALRTYNFPNSVEFFNTQLAGEGTLNRVQVAVIRLAQALKAQLVTEMRYKNLVLERSLLETRTGEIEERAAEALQEAEEAEATAASRLKAVEKTLLEAFSRVASSTNTIFREQAKNITDPGVKHRFREFRAGFLTLQDPEVKKNIGEQLLRYVAANGSASDQELAREIMMRAIDHLNVREEFERILGKDVLPALAIGKGIATIKQELNSFRKLAAKWQTRKEDLQIAQREVRLAEERLREKNEKLFAKRMLQQAITRQEERLVELQEAMRSHSANIDNYLKRVAIALEDDVNAQFYDPAFQQIRRASRFWDVNLGQIETTTVLTNNRSYARVSPDATIEFDLPQRDLLITEAMNGAKALTTEYGALMQDSTFLAASSMLSGQPAADIPGSKSPVTRLPGNPAGESQEFGAALERLIPDPAIYKFETGTAFEIRPVIQPDGHSIVYDFNYMYTTNVREPVRADEKHLGRVKRHFVNTDVQTSSYEIREVSRYTVALKASRTSRGVPLLEDIPVAGILFRPLPSQESSLQENVILAQSVIYPTMFDLMGLRWSPYADDVTSGKLVQEKQQQTYRREQLETHLLQKARSVVNEHIGIPNPRPKLVRPKQDVKPEQRPESESSERYESAPRVPPAPNGSQSWNWRRHDRRTEDKLRSSAILREMQQRALRMHPEKRE